jgi:DNA-binding transcriptional ArsR family regulator
MDSKTLSALAEPTRLKIVELLREQPRSVNEIALLLKLRQPQASKHLSQAGLVRTRAIAQQRIYSLDPEPFQRLEGWLDSFHQEWDDRLNRLDNYLNKKG